jgi:hypothetical protein
MRIMGASGWVDRGLRSSTGIMNASRHIDQQGFSAELIELPAVAREGGRRAGCQSTRREQGMPHNFQ